MPLSYRLDYPYLYWISTGKTEFDQARQAVVESFEKAIASNKTDWRIICDLTQSLENRSAEELQNTADFIATFGDLIHPKIAIVATDSLRHGTSRIFSAHSEGFGIDVTIVGALESAKELFDSGE